MCVYLITSTCDSKPHGPFQIETFCSRQELKLKKKCKYMNGSTVKPEQD